MMNVKLATINEIKKMKIRFGFDIIKSNMKAAVSTPEATKATKVTIPDVLTVMASGGEEVKLPGDFVEKCKTLVSMIEETGDKGLMVPMEADILNYLVKQEKDLLPHEKKEVVEEDVKMEVEDEAEGESDDEEESEEVKKAKEEAKKAAEKKKRDAEKNERIRILHRNEYLKKVAAEQEFRDLAKAFNMTNWLENSKMVDVLAQIISEKFKAGSFSDMVLMYCSADPKWIRQIVPGKKMEEDFVYNKDGTITVNVEEKVINFAKKDFTVNKDGSYTIIGEKFKKDEIVVNKDGSVSYKLAAGTLTFPAEEVSRVYKEVPELKPIE